MKHTMYLWSIWLAQLGMFFVAQTAAAEKIVVFGDETYAPVIYANQGKHAGILPAIFLRLSKYTGDTYELSLVPWRRAVLLSERGQGGITGISWTEKRSEIYDFSDPIYDDDIHIVVLNGKEFPFLSINDLKGKRLGGTSGASYGEEVDKAIGDGSIAVERDFGQTSRLKMLMYGRIDAAIVGNGVAGFQQLLHSDPELNANSNKFAILAHPLVHDRLFLAFAKTMHMTPALERFNKALSKLKKSGEYKQLLSVSQ